MGDKKEGVLVDEAVIGSFSPTNYQVAAIMFAAHLNCIENGLLNIENTTAEFEQLHDQGQGISPFAATLRSISWKDDAPLKETITQLRDTSSVISHSFVKLALLLSAKASQRDLTALGEELLSQLRTLIGQYK